MKVAQLKTYLDTAPVAKLLRSGNAPYVVHFLYGKFKASRSAAIAHSELLPALASFQEQLHESEPDVFSNKPESYLTEWCEQRWLRRVLEVGRNEPVYQLTPHTEEAIAFLDRALNQELGFVGTESRLRTIIRLLDELVIGASSDPQVHLERLRLDKAAIEQEIERIEREGVVVPFGPTRIREQFGSAVDLLKQLQSDFRAVEEQFRSITLRVQQQRAEGDGARGRILGDALDSEDALKREDQGVSFFEFLRFIQSPTQQDRLRDIIHQLLKIQDLAQQTDGLETVRRMMSALLGEAEKVAQTTRRLSSTLRRLLDSRVQSERRRAAELLNEIRRFAVSLNESPPSLVVGLEVEAELGITAPFSRTDWRAPTEFERLDLTNHIPSEAATDDAYRSFGELRPIDWIGLHRRIDAALDEVAHISLSELVHRRHPRARVIDIIGYLETALERRCPIDREAKEELILRNPAAGKPALLVTVPLVTFQRTEASP